MNNLAVYTGADIFDGFKRHKGAALLVSNGRINGIVPGAEIPERAKPIRLDGGLLTAGFVDLQVNGGGGVMFNNAPQVETLNTIAKAHLQFGTTSFLPTLITATPGVTDAAIEAAKAALAQYLPGIIGLHLEGPHLSVARKGAHDPALIRTMDDPECARLMELAAGLPSLMLTVAPESVSNSQIERLSKSGATVSLGHSDTDFQTASAAAAQGATCVTHLFNAMSQLGNRAPGMVGAALDCGTLWAGLIADGIHVDAASIRIALRAKQGPGRIFLISDAMATLGSDLDEFTLDGRRILRRDNRLTLADGTLAGADFDLLSAVRFLVRKAGLTVDEALRMASLYPAQLLNRSAEFGTLAAGAKADFIHLDDSLYLHQVWLGGALSVG